MKKQHLFLILIMALLLLNLGTLAYLWQRPGETRPRHQGPDRQRPEDIIISRLALDAAQQEQLWESIEKHRDLCHRYRADIKAARAAYFGLLSAPEPDSAAILSAEKDLSRAKTLLERANFIHFQEIRALCRPEQLPAFEGLLEALQPFFGGGRGPGAGHGPPPF